MGHLATHVLLAATTTATLGACSLIYNPSNLPEVVDAPPDAPPEVVRENLKLERVSPTVLFEGQGANGGRPVVLVIHGTDIAPDATISVTAHMGELNTPSIMVDLARAVVAGDHTMIAVPITLNVDANIGPSAPATSPSIRLDVTVTQPGAPTPVSLSELAGGAPVLTLQGLAELTSAQPLPTTTVHVFSHVNVASISAADRTNPLIIRSTSSIEITGAGPYSFNAAGPTLPGPGGFPGGNGGMGALGAPGMAGRGPGAGQPNSGGAGFAMPGGGAGTGGPAAGEASLTTLASPNRGSGGAGGAGTIINIEGGKGGAGGGSVELTAGGDMTIAGKIEARGTGGTTASGTTGGGGSGGVVLLRAGGALTVQSVDASGGPGNGAAGAGSDGRVRVDSPNRPGTIMSTPGVGYRGPMLDAATPMTVSKDTPTVTVIGHPGSIFKYTIEDGMGRTVGPIENTIGGSGELAFDLAMPLFRGFNKLCLLVTGVTVRRDEAENCTTIAYLP